MEGFLKPSDNRSSIFALHPESCWNHYTITPIGTFTRSVNRSIYRPFVTLCPHYLFPCSIHQVGEFQAFPHLVLFVGLRSLTKDDWCIRSGIYSSVSVCRCSKFPVALD